MARTIMMMPPTMPNAPRTNGKIAAEIRGYTISNIPKIMATIPIKPIDQSFVPNAAARWVAPMMRPQTPINNIRSVGNRIVLYTG